MDDKIKETFDKIHAEDELKDKTRAFLLKKTQGYTEYKNSRYLHAIRVAACCLFFIFIGWLGYWLYFLPTSFISIDVNPSMELGLNRFERVVSVKEYNDDGKKLADSFDLNFMGYTEALEQILADETIKNYLSQDEVLSIAIIGNDKEQSAEILSNVRSWVNGQKNIYCYSASSQMVGDAHELGLSYGKYRAYLELRELDPNITVEQVREMTMREIRNRIKALSDVPSNGTQSESEKGKNGFGNGYGSGLRRQKNGNH